MSSVTYYNRKSKGLCVLCGGEIEDYRKGLTLCSVCEEKRANKAKEDYKAYQSLRICPICHKRELYLNEKICHICSTREKKYDYAKNAERNKELKKKKYYEDKENGMCVICHKRKSLEGKTVCSICRAKRNDYLSKHRFPNKEENKNRKMDWVYNGKCYFCGNTSKKGYKVCEKHYDILLKSIHNSRNKENTAYEVIKTD